MRSTNNEEGRVKMVSPEEQADLLLSLKHEDSSRCKTQTVLIAISTLNTFTISSIIIIIIIIASSSSVQYIIIIVSEMQTAEKIYFASSMRLRCKNTYYADCFRLR